MNGTTVAHSDIRTILQAELIRRCRANPAYSLRAFARSLRINHPALSQILNGKRPISKKMYQRLAEALNLRPEERPTAQAMDTAKHYLNLEADQFAVIADWYHFAILELSLISGFRAEPSWIARRLGVSAPEIKAAVERLVRLGLIEIKNGRWINHAVGGTRQVQGRHSTAAKRLLQLQLLQKSLQAVTDVAPENRSHSSIIVAIDADKIEDARERINKFRQDMDAFLSAGRKKNAVYALHVGLFPLTKFENLNQDKIKGEKK